MTKTIEALFDGVALRPEEPLDLPPNTRVRLTIDSPAPAAKQQSFLRTARSLAPSGPPDWSANFEAYLYGQKAHPER